MTNEYYSAFMELRSKESFRAEQWFETRQDLVEQYAWAIPNSTAIEYCTKFDPLLDVGAGSGYWGYCIDRQGGNIRAMDKNPPSNPWLSVEEATVLDVYDEIEDEAVLMVWPPYNQDMAERVASIGPSDILYVGERRGGCTGTDGFFDILDERYTQLREIMIPSYNGVHDNFYHYSRKV